MAGWDDILKELGDTPSPSDLVRRKYIKQLSQYTKRNTIAYYSAFITKNGGNIDINDSDMTGFMNALKGMDCSLGSIFSKGHARFSMPNAISLSVSVLKNWERGF